jgi:hypothetical protein
MAYKAESSPSLCYFQQLAVTPKAGFTKGEDEIRPWISKAECNRQQQVTSGH